MEYINNCNISLKKKTFMTYGCCFMKTQRSNKIVQVQWSAFIRAKMEICGLAT